MSHRHSPQLTDLWCQEQHLSGKQRVLAVLVLDGLDKGGPGSRQIMSQSMIDFLHHCFPNCESQWQAFESDFDESSNLILQNQNAAGILEPVKFLDGMSLQLIFLVKRANRLKFNSHEWFLKGTYEVGAKQLIASFYCDI